MEVLTIKYTSHTVVATVDKVARDSVVGIATCYGLDGSGI